VYLASYELTSTDQKLLFDLAVQLQFAKKSSLLNLLNHQFPQILHDYPLEVLLDQDKLIEQLILFGNANDLELKLAIVPIYQILLQKMVKILENNKKNAFKKVEDSKVARQHLVSKVDEEYLRIAYPSMDPTATTQESHLSKTSNSSRRTYSFTSLLDAIIKNSFNFSVEDQLVGKFVDIFVNHILPILQELVQHSPKQVKRMVLGYLQNFRRLFENTNFKDEKQSIFLIPIFKTSIALYRTLGVETLNQGDYFGLSKYLQMVLEGYYNYVVFPQDMKDIMSVLKRLDTQEYNKHVEIGKLLFAIESLRDLEVKSYLAGNGTNHLSDKLEEYKQMHQKLTISVNGILFTNCNETIISIFVVTRCLHRQPPEVYSSQKQIFCGYRPRILPLSRLVDTVGDHA
jgi:hypothetical protein